MPGTYLFAIAARNSVSAVGIWIRLAILAFTLVSSIRTRAKDSLTQNIQMNDPRGR